MTETDRDRLMEISRFCASQGMGTYEKYLKELAGSKDVTDLLQSKVDRLLSAIKCLLDPENDTDESYHAAYQARIRGGTGMKKEQEEKFDKAFEHGDRFSQIMAAAHEGWRICLEVNGIGDTTESAVPDGYYKPGESFEARDKDHDWVKACFRVATGIGLDLETLETRRKPAWTPKEGEAVLVGVDGEASVGYIENGTVYSDRWRGKAEIAAMKPFDASKIGRAWNEI